MTETVSSEDWQALVEILNDGINKLARKKVEPVKQSILEFFTSAAMLGLDDMANVAKRFEGFLLQTIVPAWEDEAVSTLSFVMGALVEKMQMQEYGPKFSSGLGEILMYLDFYGEEEPQPSATPVEEPGEDTAAALRLEQSPSAPLSSFIDTISAEDLLADELGPDKAKLAEAEAGAGAAAEEEDEIDPFEAALADMLAEDALKPSEKEAESLEEQPETLLDAATEIPLRDESIPFMEARPEIESTKAPEATEAVGYVMDTVQWYEEVLKDDPSSQVFALLAEEYCHRDLWEDAVETCRLGLQAHPHHLKGRILLGWALWALGEEEEAERELLEARIELEKGAVLYKVLAEIARSRGGAEEAEGLLGIYRSLQSGVESLPALPPRNRKRPERKPRKLAAEVHEAPPFMDFLSELLRRYEEMPARKSGGVTIFSDTDRHALKQILCGGAC